MQTIALAAWQGGDTRVASEQGFANAVKIARAEGAWDSFRNDNGPDVANLAMNFYLKASEAGHRGFEFTHKSFGDYLAARAILDVAEELPVFIQRKVDHAMTDWVAATGTGSLSREVLTFLRDEVRLRITDSNESGALTKVVSLKSSFERFISTILTDGLPAGTGTPSWRIAETRQRNGETMAWAIINALSLTIGHFEGPEKLVNVEWPDRKASFQHLLRRLSTSRSSENPALKCFSNVVAPGADLFGLSLIGIDLRGAQMPKANFAGCHLISANLEGANLAGCKFQRAMLDGAKLEGSCLKNADLTDARVDIETTNHVNYVFDSNKPSISKVAKKIDLEGAIVSELTLLFADLNSFSSENQTLRCRHTFKWGSMEGRGDIFSRVPQIRKVMRTIQSDDGMPLDDADSDTTADP